MVHTVKLRWLLILLVLLSVSGGGCSRDPNVRKQKFIEQGNRDFQQGNYPEALIFYGRSLQIDPRSAEAHYKLAQCHLRLSNWSLAYPELMRAIELRSEEHTSELQSHLNLVCRLLLEK